MNTDSVCNERLSFCPHCGKSSLVFKEEKYWHCTVCDFHLYNNVAAAVGLILEYHDKILMIVRAKEPRKGLLALPGGFIDPQERAEDACLRECHEEIGINASHIRFLCTYPNIYEYKHITYNTCDMFFVGTIDTASYPSETDFLASLSPQISEVTSFYLLDKNDIDTASIAFASTVHALQFYKTHMSGL